MQHSDSCSKWLGWRWWACGHSSSPLLWLGRCHCSRRSCGNSTPRRGGTSCRGSQGGVCLALSRRSGPSGWRWGSGCCRPQASQPRSGPVAETSRQSRAVPPWLSMPHPVGTPWPPPSSWSSWIVSGSTHALMHTSQKHKACYITNAHETEWLLQK